MLEHQFTCRDAAGEIHNYTCTRHRGSEGMGITLQLSSLVIEPLVTAAGPAIIQAMREDGIKSLKDFDFETLNFPMIASTLRQLLGRLPPQLIYECFRYTNRDNQPLVRPETSAKPSAHFDEAFAGNYLEIAKAAWEVCEANGFFPGLDSLASVAEKALSAAVETTKSETANGAPAE